MSKTTKPPFHVITSIGRESREHSLAEAVDAACFLANKIVAAAVTCSPDDDPRCWYVYASQRALDVDLQRGPIGPKSPNWFAIVRDVGP